MNMKKGFFCKAFITIVTLFTTLAAYAQDGAYSGYTPYSIFAIGDLMNQGSAYNAGMGGVGIATRNKRYINYLNPASVTARDTLSFMADMSLHQANKVFAQNDMKTVNNTFNISSLALSFPVYKSSAMMFGLAPYSSTGYGCYLSDEDPQMIEDTGGLYYSSTGQGSLFQVFGAFGVTFWNRLSLGVQVNEYVGNIAKSNKLDFINSAFSDISSGSNLILRGTSGKFGLQYEQPLGNNLTLGVGATYKLGSRMRGYSQDYQFAVGAVQTDTLRFSVDTLAKSHHVNFADEIAIGISLNSNDRWRAEIDYTRSDWTNTGVTTATGFAVNGQSKFTATCSESLRAGFEIVPNRNDIRYFYRRCAYRLGAYREKSYYLMDGNNVSSMGITVGGTIPVFRYYNGVTWAVDLGQRGTSAQNMIRERYVKFTIGFNFFDYWFQKARYN